MASSPESTNDWMVDIETTGLRPDRAGILSIGAVQFDRRSFEPTGARFFTRLALPESRAWDANTATWWQKQSPEAWAAATAGDGLAPAAALALMVEAFGSTPWFWSKPAHFDYPFVEGYFAEFGIKSPLHHRKVMDVRTWIATRPEAGQAAAAAFEALPFSGVIHDPTDDCLHALGMLRAAMMEPANAE
jgi:hypothetical protein